jgi:hypothetical protein
MKPRVAVCLVGEPRGIKTCIESFYENIVNPLNAGIFYSFNRATPEDEEKIQLINKKVIIGEIKEKCNLRKELVPDSLYNKFDEMDFYFQSNWVGTVNGLDGGVCYRHVDFKRMGQIISDYLSAFDYFIITRSDFRYLFPIFDFSILKDVDIVKHKGSDHFSNTGMNWEFIVCHKSKVLEYLNSPYVFMNDESLQDFFLPILRERPRNNESFQRIISDYYGWRVLEMDINGFLSADNDLERTTWGHVQYDQDKKVHFKYPEMMDDAYSNFTKISSGLKWKLENKEIKIC